MSGRSSRRKGQVAERELAALLTEKLGYPVLRDLSQTRDGGLDLQVGVWRLEVKRQESLSIGRWWTQAWKGVAGTGYRACVAYRKSRKPWRVMMDLSVDEFLAVVGFLRDRRMARLEQAESEDR